MTLQTWLIGGTVFVGLNVLLVLFFHASSAKQKRQMGSRYWDK